MNARELTKKQAAAMRLFVSNGDVCEADMQDLWPLIRRPRLVTNGLLAKGLVRLGYWDDQAGYELHLTDAGRALLAEQEPTGGGG
jgi:hypothetical protein